jgi:hypothetical protein
MDRRLMIGIGAFGLLLIAGAIVLRKDPSHPEQGDHRHSPPPPPLKPPPQEADARPPGRPFEEKVLELTSIVNCKRDAVLGAWELNGGTLISPPDPFARLEFPCRPPEEYDLNLLAQRTEGNNSLNIGLVAAGRQLVIIIDGWENGEFTGVDQILGKPFYGNETTSRKRLLHKNQARAIRCSVRKDRLTVTVDSEPVIDWKGKVDDIGIIREWNVRHSDALFIGSWSTSFRLSAIQVVPVSGTMTVFQ